MADSAGSNSSTEPRIVESRYTKDGHEDIIINLLNDYACGLAGGGSPISEYARNNLVAEMEKRSTIHTVIAFVDDGPAGLAIAIEGFSTFACRTLLNIHDLYVAPGFRNRGIAGRLLGRMEEIALRLDCCKLTLEVLENNTIAQKLYHSFGFVSYELDPSWGRALFLEKKL